MDWGGYYENGEFYSFGTGPLQIEGNDKNMFNRCKQECFSADKPKAKFLFKVKGKKKVRRQCSWLRNQNKKRQRRICLFPQYHLFRGKKWKPASRVCRDICRPFMEGQF